VRNGEFAFLPDDVPSRLAEEGFRTAFPEDMLESSIVLVVRREAGDQGLEDADRQFIVNVLVPELHRLAGVPMPRDEEDEELAAETSNSAASDAAASDSASAEAESGIPSPSVNTSLVHNGFRIRRSATCWTVKIARPHWLSSS
jgi:hypothetical protein